MIRRIAFALSLGLGLALGLLWLLGSQNPVALADPGILYVAPGGDCGGATPCYATVQAAVDAASAADEIRVAAGTYTGVSARAGVAQTVYISKTVTIRGGYTTSDWDTPDPAANLTTLDAQGLGRVMVISGTIAPTIEGLRLTGGDATGLGPFYWGDVGGGVYVANATPAISGNVVYSNTADRGGGLYLWYSPATLNSNTVSNNIASGGGGGVELRYSPATLNGNTINDNTGSGYGGGLNLNDSNAALSGNVIYSNTATSGGGVSVYWSTAILSDNSIYSNTAYYGGGLHVYGGPSTLVGNVVTGNIAFEGGGMYLDYSAPTLVNNVVADNTVNQATGLGSGIYVEYSSPHLLHTTIAGNSGGDGSGVYVTAYESSGTYYPSTVVMTNTIISSHTVGITVTAGNAATLNATLWHGNSTDTGGAGSITTINDRGGDPAFAADGYHLTTGSMAIDRGVSAGVATDIDGDPRPQGAGYDIGADEFPAAPADVAWDKQIRINGGSFRIWSSGPFTVAPGDDVTIVERVWVTATWNISFTLGEAWTPSLEWMTYEATTGTVSQAGRTAAWSVTNAAPNAWHVLTKTLRAVASPEYADTLTETLKVQGVAFQLPERIVEFQQPHPQSAWDKTVRINDGASQTWGAGPFAVTPGDTVTIVDRVWITHTADVTFFTLAQNWGPALELDGWTYDAGTVVAGPGTLTWHGIGEPANQWHTLTTTLYVAGTDWLYESVTETLTVEDATSQPPQREVSLVNVSASTGCYARINDGSTTYPTVQSAVDAAQPGDLVKVAGHCTTINHYGGLAQVVYLDKSLTIHGGYITTNWTMPDPAAHPTTLDAQGQGRVIYITGYIAPTIEGLRITGGDARWFGSSYWDRIGGGIHVYAATAVLSGNVIYSNTATGGGGLGLYHSPATLNGNTICGNTATDGGGLGLYYLYYGLAALNGNMISGNTASQQGGGLYLNDADLMLNDNIISGNNAAYGGGLYLWDSAPTLINTVVADNTATGLGAGMAAYRSSPHLLHTTIARNTGGDGSGIHVLEGAPSSAIFNNTIIVSHTVGITVATGNAATLNATLWHANGTDTGGAGSISTLSDHTGDPAFAPDGYHLTSRSAAIDAGVDAGVTTDIDGDARPWGAGYDIGADELRQRYVYLPIVLKSW